MYECLSKVPDKYQLRPHIHFDEAMEQMVWDEHASTWTVSTAKGTYVADVVIASTGSLVEAKPANIKGAESPTGAHFNSSQWDHQQSL
ncbi:MAG: cation diffusion facilitator CzcD-associated flavoprotein CzcO [Gammaproteobacteria bacterium]